MPVVPEIGKLISTREVPCDSQTAPMEAYLDIRFLKCSLAIKCAQQTTADELSEA